MLRIYLKRIVEILNLVKIRLMCREMDEGLFLLLEHFKPYRSRDVPTV